MAGADVNALDSIGMTPLDWADLSFDKDTVRELLDHGGKRTRD